MTRMLDDRSNHHEARKADAVQPHAERANLNSPQWSVRGWWCVPVAATGGLLNALAFPGLGWWPLILVGTPLLLASFVAAPWRTSIAAAAVGAGVFWGVHTFWLTVYLGAAPWLGLAGLQTVFTAIASVVIGVVWRAAEAILQRTMIRLVVIPVLAAGLWVGRELISGMWPYGGFSWGKLSYSQSESPLGELTAWVGVAGLSFLLVAVSAHAVQLIRDRRRVATPLLILPIAVAAGLVAVPPFPVDVSGTMKIGAVQGNSESGLLAENRPGRILEDHVAASEPLLGEDLDLLVWPENAADLDPLRDTSAARTLDELSRQVDAPMLLGTVTVDRDRMFNSTLLWEPGSGATAQYDKKHLVPFAEYLPDRDFWFPLAPDLFSLIPRDFSIGTRPNVIEVNEVLAGVAICFDIVDDALIRDMVAGGAQIILAPTNNADFGRTDQSAQQLAIARLRAIEAGRSVVNISTVATSAMITPDGTTLDQLQPFTSGAMVNEVPLSSSVTPAIAFGLPLAWSLAGTSVAGAAVVVLLAQRNRRRDGT